MTDVEPWQVWWVNFDPQHGREQKGDRPAIVVGTELACQIPNGLALVVPCTSTDRNLPWHVNVDLGDRKGVAMCDQVKSIDQGRLRRQHPCKILTDPDQRAEISRVLGELVMTT